MTRVVHCKKEPYDIYIGRPSIWGNPYSIGKDGPRNIVTNKYWRHIMNHSDLLAQVKNLKGKVLGCWCAPKVCHGDILVKLAELT